MSFDEKMKMVHKTLRKALYSAREGLEKVKTVLEQMLFLLAKIFLCYTTLHHIPLKVTLPSKNTLLVFLAFGRIAASAVGVCW